MYLENNEGKPYSRQKGKPFTFKIHRRESDKFPYSISFWSQDWSPSTVRDIGPDHIIRFLEIFNTNNDLPLSKYMNLGGRSRATRAPFLVTLFRDLVEQKLYPFKNQTSEKTLCEKVVERKLQLPDGNWKILSKLPTYCESGAIFNAYDWQTARYRYSLWRVWDCKLHRLLFIMLNSSLGNHLELTPTSKFCDKLAKQGLKIENELIKFGSVEVVNLFAFRSPNPRDLKNQDKDLIGPQNDYYIKEALINSKVSIAAWGFNKKSKKRGIAIFDLVSKMGIKLYRLDVTRGNFPCHPRGVLFNLERVGKSFGEYIERPRQRNK
jgi:hypothetical protein